MEALNISEQNLQAWSSEAPEGKPLLVWCLEQGKISSQEYLQWACAHYGLAVVSPAFFSQALDRAFVSVQRESGAWNPWCYPVEHWDDISIVACVEPPHELLPKTCYVLADPVAMLEAWGSEDSKASAAPDLPDGMSLEPTKKPFRLNLGAETESPAPEETQHRAELTTSEVLSQNTPIPFVLNLPEATSTDLPPIPFESKVPEAPPPPKPQAKPPAVKAETTTKTFSKQVSPEEAEQSILATLERLEKSFDGVFVMKCSEAKADLYRWGQKINPVNKGKDAKVELVYPSLFRIVSRTLLPYHGYVVDSPAHREFFQALNIADLPKCVCAVPIKRDSQLLGMLVTVGQEAHQAMDFLKLVEHEAEGLASKLVPSWSKAA